MFLLGTMTAARGLHIASIMLLNAIGVLALIFTVYGLVITLKSRRRG